MTDPLDSIEAQLEPRRNFDSPPLDKWHPELSGDIPIVIKADGTWYHDGDPIRRESLVRLFASILRREADGEYYLVTPVEKWRIRVDLHPLMVTDVEEEGGDLYATLNTDRRLQINAEHPLSLESSLGGVAVLGLPHGLTALFTRAAWYRLVELAVEEDDRSLVKSGEYSFDLAAT